MKIFTHLTWHTHPQIERAHSNWMKLIKSFCIEFCVLCSAFDHFDSNMDHRSKHDSHFVLLCVAVSWNVQWRILFYFHSLLSSSSSALCASFAFYERSKFSFGQMNRHLTTGNNTQHSRNDTAEGKNWILKWFDRPTTMISRLQKFVCLSYKKKCMQTRVHFWTDFIAFLLQSSESRQSSPKNEIFTINLFVLL